MQTSRKDGEACPFGFTIQPVVESASFQRLFSADERSELNAGLFIGCSKMSAVVNVVFLRECLRVMNGMVVYNKV